jgi:hypothetical protein
MFIYYDLFLPDIPQHKKYKGLIKFWQLVDDQLKDSGLFEFWKIALDKARSKESNIEDIDQHFDSFKLGYIDMNYILNVIKNI